MTDGMAVFANVEALTNSLGLLTIVLLNSSIILAIPADTQKNSLV